MIPAFLASLVVGFVCLAVFIYAFQGRMLFLADSTSVTDDTVRRAVTSHGAEELHLEGHDGVRLHGFFLPGAGDAPRATVLYFGGNAENLGNRTGDHDDLREAGLNLALVCYRGYGRSEGTPTSRDLLADALCVYDSIVAREDVDAARVHTWGRSLGTGVAAHVAANRPVESVVLVAPYTRLSDAAAHHYAWLPVRRFFSNEIDTMAVAGEIDTPAILFHGDCDLVIPYEQAVQLAGVWRPTPRLVTLEGRGHNDPDGDPAYRREALRFLCESAGA